MPNLALYFLGPPQIKIDGKPLPFDRRKAVALLAYLATTRQSHSRDTLAAIFWPEGDQSHARGSLRRDLSALNKALSTPWLVINRESVSLNWDAGIRVDVHTFRQLITAAREHPHANSKLCTECLSTLTEASALYQDDFLAGFTLRDSPQFDDWQFFEAQSLRNDLADVLAKLVQMHEALNEYDFAIEHARRWLTFDPLDESVHRQLMQLFVVSGQRNAALRQYAECVRILDSELSVSPEPETTNLYKAIKENRPLASQDLNKDGPTSTTAPPHNLPVALTPLIAREQEQQEISALLDDTGCRLLTISGPGGVGKTRLAVQVAAEKLADFPHGVWFVSLAGLGSADFIESAIADALGFAFSAQGNPRVQLLNYLQNKQMLLVLDNFDYLIPKANLIVELLRNAPNLQLLVTSRQRLNVREECTFHLDGLEIPANNTSTDIEEYGAIQLFVEAARRTDPNFSLDNTDRLHIVDIVRMVAGTPLGIELASAWVRMLPSHEIAEQIKQNLDFLSASLSDLPERQRSLRAAFNYSWELLSEDEQAIFRQLSLFRGGFLLNAAEAVADASLSILSALVDKSFLQATRVYQPKSSIRYTFHDHLRQYGEEQLRAAGNYETIQTRFFAYYSGFLHSIERSLKGGQQTDALTAIQQEIDNVRPAWLQASAAGAIEHVAKALDSLWLFFEITGRFLEGEELFAKAVESLRHQNTPGNNQEFIVGQLLARQGAFAYRLGLFADSRTLLEESLSILNQADAQAATAFALNILGNLFRAQGHYDEAQQRLEESSAISREFNDQWLLAYTLSDLGAIARLLGRHEAAKEYQHDSLSISKITGDQRAIMLAYTELGANALAEENFSEARRLYEEILAIAEEFSSPWGIAMAQNELGTIAYQMGAYAEADELLQQSLSLYRDIGYKWGIISSLNQLGNVALTVEAHSEARRYYLEALQIASDIRATRLTLRVFAGLAALEMEEENLERAAELLAFCHTHPASETETIQRANELLSHLKDSPTFSQPPEMHEPAELDQLIQVILGEQ